MPEPPKRLLPVVVLTLMVLVALALIFFGVWAASESIKKVHFVDATSTPTTSVTDFSR